VKGERERVRESLNPHRFSYYPVFPDEHGFQKGERNGLYKLVGGFQR